MKSRNISLALAGLVAICLIAMPAFSMPAGFGAPNAPCNASEKVSCNAMGTGVGPRGTPGMEFMGDPARGIYGMGHMKIMNGKNATWNGTKTMEIRQGGNGFAIGSDQYHILKMSIEGTVTPNLDDIKNLISDNKTIAQIKSDIKAKMDAEISAASYNGSLRLGQNSYNLVNIKNTPSKDNSTIIEADVAGPKTNPTDKPTTIAGHISISASRHENSTIGEGTLTINSGEYSGQYKALLEMGDGIGRRNGPDGCHAFAGANNMGERFGMNKEMGMFREKIDEKA